MCRLITLAYSTLPVQPIARIATTEDADCIRDEDDVSSAEEQAAPSSEGDAHVRDPSRHPGRTNAGGFASQLHVPKLKYAATPQEVHVPRPRQYSALLSARPPLDDVRVQRRDDDADESEVEVLIISSYSRHLEFLPKPQALLETSSPKNRKLILASFSHGPSRSVGADFATVPDNDILRDSGRDEEGKLGRMLFERWDKS